MPGFRENANSTAGRLSWEGDPDDDAAHQTILTWLQDAVTALAFSSRLNPCPTQSRAISVSSLHTE